MKSEDKLVLVQIGDRIVNMRFVREVKLDGAGLKFVMPTPGGETTYFLHKDAKEVFRRLTASCINKAP